jgi:NAD(P)-dependent dehydrogenase (short-subunit alcohol dehydrogenase family)
LVAPLEQHQQAKPGVMRMAYKPFDLNGKVALVTGGNRGIGYGMAEALALSGADVVIWGSNTESNKQAEEKLKAHGGSVFSQTVDVADEQQVVDAMAQANAWKGRLDTVIANAGIGRGSPSFVEMTTETYRKVLSVNLDGVFFTFREACRHMVERSKSTGEKGGSIIGVASLADGGGAEPSLRRHKRGGDLYDEVGGGGARALGRPRQRHPAGLDRHRHDGRRPGQ